MYKNKDVSQNKTNKKVTIIVRKEKTNRLETDVSISKTAVPRSLKMCLFYTSGRPCPRHLRLPPFSHSSGEPKESVAAFRLQSIRMFTKRVEYDSVLSLYDPPPPVAYEGGRRVPVKAFIAPAFPPSSSSSSWIPPASPRYWWPPSSGRR